jgi:hypothetical protein
MRTSPIICHSPGVTGRTEVVVLFPLNELRINGTFTKCAVFSNQTSRCRVLQRLLCYFAHEFSTMHFNIILVYPYLWSVFVPWDLKTYMFASCSNYLHSWHIIHLSLCHPTYICGILQILKLCDVYFSCYFLFIANPGTSFCTLCSEPLAIHLPLQ